MVEGAPRLGMWAELRVSDCGVRTVKLLGDDHNSSNGEECCGLQVFDKLLMPIIPQVNCSRHRMSQASAALVALLGLLAGCASAAEERDRPTVRRAEAHASLTVI